MAILGVPQTPPPPPPQKTGIGDGVLLISLFAVTFFFKSLAMHVEQVASIGQQTQSAQTFLSGRVAL